MKLKIFSGSTNRKLAESICKSLHEPLGDCYLHTFPSGEKYCQFKENIRGCDVYIIQSGYPNVNDAVMELLIMADAARRAAAQRITLVIPYFPYARQDRKTKSRTPITARLVADLIESRYDRVITMDLHAAQVQGFFNIPFDHLYSFPVISSYIFNSDMCPRDINHTNKIDVIVSPDTGGIKRAAALASICKKNFGFINKKRIGDMEVEMSDINGDVKNKNVLIVDDMTESAGTIIEAAKVCRNNGATNIYGAVTHGLLNDKARTRLSTENELDSLIVTDTVDIETHPKCNVLSVYKIFAKAIKRTHQNESVSDLFDIDGF